MHKWICDRCHEEAGGLRRGRIRAELPLKNMLFESQRYSDYDLCEKCGEEAHEMLRRFFRNEKTGCEIKADCDCREGKTDARQC